MTNRFVAQPTNNPPVLRWAQWCVVDTLRPKFDPTDDGQLGTFGDETVALEYADSLNLECEPCGCRNAGDWVEPCESHATVVQITRTTLLIAANESDAQNMVIDAYMDGLPSYLIVSDDETIEELPDGDGSYRNASLDTAETSGQKLGVDEG